MRQSRHERSNLGIRGKGFLFSLASSAARHVALTERDDTGHLTRGDATKIKTHAIQMVRYSALRISTSRRMSSRWLSCRDPVRFLGRQRVFMSRKLTLILPRHLVKIAEFEDQC